MSAVNYHSRGFVDPVDPMALGPRTYSGGDFNPEEADSSLLVSATNGQAGTIAKNTTTVYLEKDCYSIVAARGTPFPLAMLLPITAFCCQATILNYLASGPFTFFNDGHWNQPLSEFTSVNVIKFVALLVVIFKVSGEFRNAQQLYAVLVSEVLEDRRHWFFNCYQEVVRYALVLQYFAALVAFLVAVDIILATETCADTIIKMLSISIVVDLDNLMAGFVSQWLVLDFTVEVTSAKMVKLGHMVCDLNLDSIDSEEEEGGLEEDPSKPMRLPIMPGMFCFYVIPLMIMSVELTVTMVTGVLPLTLCYYGMVSNVAPPEVPLTPFVLTQGVSSAEYTVLILAPPQSPPPVLYWVGVSAAPEPKPPHSLQVMLGSDGGGNLGFQYGTVQTEAVQAKYWLQIMNYSSSTYHTLEWQHLLYRNQEPYAATFTLTNLKNKGAAYRVYVTAQNPHTKALATAPQASALLVVSSKCGSNCQECMDQDPTICMQCIPGMHLTAAHTCKPCPPNCAFCEESDKECDRKGCQKGFGLNGSLQCAACAVGNCNMCDFVGEGSSSRSFNTSCSSCAVGFGRVQNASGDYCMSCDDDCAQCNSEDRSDCLECKGGYAKVQLPGPELEQVDEDMLPVVSTAHSICKPCMDNCKNCSGIDPLSCYECSWGYGFLQDYKGKRCERCDHYVNGCQECAWNIHGKFSCISCTKGLGVSSNGECTSCGERCSRCSSAGTCEVCVGGFALGARPTDETSTKVCLSCADNCRKCKTAGPQKCDTCYEGFYLDNKTRLCESTLLG